VLRGAKETIVRCKPLVVFEHSPYSAPYYGYGAEEMFGYFDDVGLRHLLAGRLSSQSTPSGA